MGRAVEPGLTGAPAGGVVWMTSPKGAPVYRYVTVQPTAIAMSAPVRVRLLASS
jgi:hypothetical protein